MSVGWLLRGGHDERNSKYALIMKQEYQSREQREILLHVQGCVKSYKLFGVKQRQMMENNGVQKMK